MTSRWKPLSLVLVGGLIVGACTSAATPVPTAAPTAAASSNAPDGTLPAPELKSVKLGLLVGEPSQFAPQLAQMLGLYEKYGLTAQVTIFNGDADAAAAVVSGSVDMGSVGASAAMNSQLTDRPAKVITIAKAKVIDGLFCGPSIKSAADLKGKSVAASTLGGTAHASILLALEALLFTDVHLSGRGALRDQESIAPYTFLRPESGLPALARWVAVNMTPLVWPGYLVLLEGVLVIQTGTSPVRRRPHHFALLCLASVVIWCVFDWINFYFIHAWVYIGMPQANPSTPGRTRGWRRRP